MRRCQIILFFASAIAAPVRAQVLDPPELSARSAELGCVLAVSQEGIAPTALATEQMATTERLATERLATERLANPNPPAALPADPERAFSGSPAPSSAAERAPRPATPLPPASAVADLSRAQCLSVLREHGVGFQELDSRAARGVGIPVRVRGPIGGVRIASRGHSELHEIMDCRLVVALLLWAPELTRAGVRGLLHYSTYRPGARVAHSGQPSGHASALAIDLAVVVMADGAEQEVLTDWGGRARGEDPCAGRSPGGDAVRLRSLVCGVAGSGLFQIILTPHYDAAHANHVHLELRPGVRWQYVH